jgi:sterol desaturase/sphingolipid hydroxylase (fatty acid hydroxylase superfamily)
MFEPRGSFLIFAVPVFVVTMILEVAFTRAKLYRLNDTISSLSAGVMSMLVANLMHAVMLTQYIAVRSLLESLGLVVNLPLNSTWTFVLLLVCVDLAYYWAHRYRKAVFFFFPSFR